MGHLIVTSRAGTHGFLAFDWWHRRDEALKRLASWQQAGKIRFKEDVLGGIERMPEAFLRLLQGNRDCIKIAPERGAGSVPRHSPSCRHPRRESTGT